MILGRSSLTIRPAQLSSRVLEFIALISLCYIFHSQKNSAEAALLLLPGNLWHSLL